MPSISTPVSSALLAACLGLAALHCGGEDDPKTTGGGASGPGTGGDATTSTTATTSGAGGEGEGGAGAAGGSSGAGGSGEGGAGAGEPVGACDPGAAKCDLYFSGTGFEAEGKTLHFGIVKQGSTKGLEFKASTVITGGKFSVHEAARVDKNAPYNLNYFVDMDGDGKCSTSIDQPFRISLPSGSEHVVVAVTGDKNGSNLGCGGF